MEGAVRWLLRLSGVSSRSSTSAWWSFSRSISFSRLTDCTIWAGSHIFSLLRAACCSRSVVSDLEVSSRRSHAFCSLSLVSSLLISLAWMASRFIFAWSERLGRGAGFSGSRPSARSCTLISWGCALTTCPSISTNKFPPPTLTTFPVDPRGTAHSDIKHSTVSPKENALTSLTLLQVTLCSPFVHSKRLVSDDTMSTYHPSRRAMPESVANKSRSS
mmetsp:Transcript_123275/g.343829  ORF Transcript_123275/g.343829 Transcript_123275/m.343829 type:complete len:217 (-) Transcript_123275:140-790(-)